MAAGRTKVLAVLTGAVVWAVFWIGGSLAAQSLAPEVLAAGQPVTHAGALLGFIGYSVVLSVLAGYLTAAVSRGDPLGAVRWLAGVQFVLGVGFEASAWSLTPVWYHLVFLALIIPATLYGGRLRTHAARTLPAAFP